MEEKLITTREASAILGISEQDVIDLANAGNVASIKVGGEYLRYRRKDILEKKDELKRKAIAAGAVGKRTMDLREFLYFYDFYVVCGVVIVVLLWFILADTHV